MSIELHPSPFSASSPFPAVLAVELFDVGHCLLVNSKRNYEILRLAVEERETKFSPFSWPPARLCALVVLLDIHPVPAAWNSSSREGCFQGWETGAFLRTLDGG